MAKEQLITLADVLQLLRLEELPARQLMAGDVAFLPRIGLVAVPEVLLSPKTVTVVVDDVDDSEHVLCWVAPRHDPLRISLPPVRGENPIQTCALVRRRTAASCISGRCPASFLHRKVARLPRRKKSPGEWAMLEARPSRPPQTRSRPRSSGTRNISL